MHRCACCVTVWSYLKAKSNRSNGLKMMPKKLPKDLNAGYPLRNLTILKMAISLRPSSWRPLRGDYAVAKVRVSRVGEQIKKELSLILQTSFKDPRLGFITVTGVD